MAIAPSSSYASRYDMVYQGGAFYLSDGLGWKLGQAATVPTSRTSLDAHGPFRMPTIGSPRTQGDPPENFCSEVVRWVS